MFWTNLKICNKATRHLEKIQWLAKVFEDSLKQNNFLKIGPNDVNLFEKIEGWRIKKMEKVAIGWNREDACDHFL